MKAIQINSIVNLNNGLSIPSGAVVIIAEEYANIKSMTNDLIPCQVITQVFASLADYQSGKSNVTQIADFNPSFTGLTLSVTGYETLPMQDLAIGVVQEALELIYPGNIVIITI